MHDLVVKRRGNQDPTLEVRIKEKESHSILDNPQVQEMIRQWGYNLLPWQMFLLRIMLMISIDEAVYLYRWFYYTVPRQSGKNVVLEVRILLGCIVLNEEQTYTAHNKGVAAKFYKRIHDRILRNKKLRKYFPRINPNLKITNSNDLTLQAYVKGKQAGSCVFITRGGSADKLRGLSGEVVYFDESQELVEDQLAGATALIKSRPRGQIVFLGTPPKIDITALQSGGTVKSKGEYISSQRKRIIESNPARTSWIEWGIDKFTDRNDIEAIYRTNPSIGFNFKDDDGTLIEHTLENVQTDPMSDEDFLYECLGYWPSQSRASIIDITLWKDLEVSLSEFSNINRGGNVAIALKTTTGVGALGGRCDVAIAVNRGDITKVELVQSFDMRTAWLDALWSFLEPYLNSPRCKSVVIDGRDGQAAIIAKLIDKKYWNPKGNRLSQKKVSLTQTMDITQASALFVSSVTEKKIKHHPQIPLDMAVEDAGKRKIGQGGGYAFQSLSGKVDVNYLEAAALAVYSASQNIARVDDGTERFTKSGAKIRKGFGG